MLTRPTRAWWLLAVLLLTSPRASLFAEQADGPEGAAGPAAAAGDPLPAIPPETAPLSPPQLATLAGYSTALRLNLQRNPSLAAAYLAFWSEVGEADRAAGSVEQVPAGRFDEIAGLTGRVAARLAGRYGAGAGDYRLADTVTVALAALADEPPGGSGAAAPAAGRGRAERFLRLLDGAVVPRVLVNGRYEYAGSLQGRADLGISGDLWMRCRRAPACVAAHDALFAGAMGGASLSADFDERVAKDRRLRESPELPVLRQELGRATPVLGGGDDGQGLRAAARAAATGYWQSLGEQLALLPGSRAGEAPAAAVAELPALLTLGRSTAWLAGAPPLATSFGILGQPLGDYARLSAGGGRLAGFMAATTGIGLLFAGVQALALFDDPASGAAGQAPAPPELVRLVSALHDTTYRNFVGLRADNLLASNAIDTRLAALGVALDVVKDDVARIESAQRRKVRADFLAQAARRWTAFEADNDRCFSLRSQDPRTGVLRTAEFRRCEERFLQGAVRLAQYANRSTDYLLDARYLEAADLRFPFHHHYPLLLTGSGLDTKAALALADPFEWQQHAAALVRLYQENPAGPGDPPRRAEVLRTLRAAGSRTTEALTGLALTPGADGRPVFREVLHAAAIDDYLGSLEALGRRLKSLDDPDADRYGKRLTRDLLQPLPGGRKLAAIEALLSGAAGGTTGLPLCADAPDEDFLPVAGGLQAEARRFFASPVTEAELSRAWNRPLVEGLQLAPQSFAALVPRRFLWASLDGLGRLDLCLARFRPVTAEFSRDEAAVRNHFRGSVAVEASVAVRFSPSASVREALGLDPAAPPVAVARYTAARACSFGYRSDNEGCSRGQCLASLAPLIWSGDSGEDLNGGRCGGEPLPVVLAAQNELAGASELRDLAAALEPLYWQGRAARVAALGADVRRSSEFEAASAAYLRYFALAGLTLATYPDVTEPLAPLFTADGRLAPQGYVRALLDDRRDPAALAAELAGAREQVLAVVAGRGSEVARGDGVYRLPPLHALRETLTRIDLLLAAYRGGS